MPQNAEVRNPHYSKVSAMPGAENPLARQLNDPPSAEAVQECLTGFLLGEQFACIGGRIAARRGAVVHRHYDRLGAAQGTESLYADLHAFADGRDRIDPLYATFIATFAAPRRLDETQFETLLWEQLQLLHDIDRTRHGWADGFSCDPMADKFAYSIAGQPFFIVGMHGNASRLSRRFPWPALAFNSHVQFQRLRENGLMQKIRKIVRRRELQIQGSLNPRLIEFGYRPESIRYAGRAVEAGWRCPFRAEQER
jgi:uncharacterized protein